MELTPATIVKLAERESAEQLGSYLGLIASARGSDRRRLTISTAGTGQRDLLVSYVSEVPVWKTTYRIVLSPDDVPPLLQGWAIVDNTTGEDWINVDLSLVAGAPQSFVEHISEPLYARRPVVQPSGAVLRTPQTHDATLAVGVLQETVTVSGSSPAAPAAGPVERGVVGGSGVPGAASASSPPPRASAMPAGCRTCRYLPRPATWGSVQHHLSDPLSDPAQQVGARANHQQPRDVERIPVERPRSRSPCARCG
jgi:hypothetical protein